ncbi:MAG: tetratricopeptide repeat protein [Candidatus Gastranaerophilales bacterium]|nr:tetratricopeptide repeat protein [Candidatus Gastranaerophilales bacterium]
MKKLLLLLLAGIMLSSAAFAQKQAYNSKLQEAIWMYKKMNYTGCMQLTLDVVEDDPSNVLAYYYLAISTARLGNKKKAVEAYNKVIEINSSAQLSNYAKNGIICIEKPAECPSGTTEGDPAKKAVDDVKKSIEQRKLDSVKDIINTKQDVKDVPYDYMKDFTDFSKPQKKSGQPAKEEIADALETLKRAGYGNFVQPQNFAMTPEMMQMSMLMGSTGNNSGMNAMLPYMMNMQGQTGQNIDPQLMQSMIMGSMMQDMYSNFGTADNK